MVVGLAPPSLVDGVEGNGPRRGYPIFLGRRPKKKSRPEKKDDHPP